jgi:hypothetical protein
VIESHHTLIGEIFMVRTFENKNGDVFEWEETKEVVEAIQAYWKLVNENLANRR